VSATNTSTLSLRVPMKPNGHVATNLLASEWTKIRSVRSTYWTLLAAVGATIGLSAIVCAVFVSQYAKLKPADKAAFHAASVSLTGALLAQLAIAVLGVLVVTSEYGSGMIRTTLAAVPRRISVLAAKAAVFGAVTMAVATVACFAAFFIGQGILSAKDIGVDIGSPHALRTVLATSLYLTILGLLALGIGTVIRKTAGAISAVVGMIFVLPVVASFLPSSMEAIQKFLPSNAAQSILNGGSNARSGVEWLSPWAGLGVFFLYAIVALGAGALSFVRRDA